MKKLLAGYRLVREPGAVVPWDGKRPVLDEGKKVAALIRPLARLEESEVIWAMPVDPGLVLLTPGPVVVVRGKSSGVMVEVGRCFQVAVQVGATGLIVAHNHTNGRIEPTLQDRLFTERLREAGRVLDCELLDHVIVGVKQFYSFTEGK
jgi:DNA repair protein RadC